MRCHGWPTRPRPWGAALALHFGVAMAGLCSCGGIAVHEIDPPATTTSSATGVDPTAGCEPGRADCNADTADGCEIDLQSDAAHCGSCGHDCQGGPCQSSECQPEIVASNQEYAYRIAANESHVYWTRSDGSVLRASVQGGEPEVVASGQNGPGDIALDATSVYWANVGDGTIVKAPFGGGEPAVIASGGAQPWSLAVSGATLVWTDNGSGEVRAISLAGGGAPPITIATTPGAWGVAADESRVYWSTLFQGAVYRAPIGGGDSTALASDLISPGDLAIAGSALYFGTASDAGVFAVPIEGGAVTSLAPEGGFGVAADAEHVYFGEYDGRLVRVPVGGGEIAVLGMGPTTVTDIALTSTSVYWAAAGGEGVIMRVAK